jgi:hypothetical protein
MEFSNGQSILEKAQEASDEGVYLDYGFSVVIDPASGQPIALYRPGGQHKEYRVVSPSEIVPLLKALLVSYAENRHAQYVDRLNAQIASPEPVVVRSEFPNAGYVYLLKSSTGFYKIGRSKQPTTRIKTMHVALPFEIETEHLIECEDYIEAETLLHNEFKAKRMRGEWFALEESDVNEIKNIKRMKKGGMVEVVGQPTEE